MLVAAIISLAAAGVMVLVALTIVFIVLRIRARSAPRRRRRQTETAARLFDDSAISAWSNNDSAEWSDDQREAALIYYNTAGRRARISGIRADLIPDNHRNHIARLTESIDDNDASRAKWSDLLWLAARVEKQSSTSRSAPQHDAELPGGFQPPTGDGTEVINLATALGLNGSTIDMNEMEDAGDATTPPTPRGPSGNSHIHSTGRSHPVYDSSTGADAPDPDALNSDTRSSDTLDAGGQDSDFATRDGQDLESPGGDNGTPAGQHVDEPDRDPTSQAETDPPLPDVPAWILEARAALPKMQTPDPSEAGATTSPDPPDPKPILAGTDFPWPRTAINPQQVAISDDVPEPVDFIPDIDTGDLGPSDDDNTVDSKSGSPDTDSEQIAGENDDEQGLAGGQVSNGQGPTENESTDVGTAGAEIAQNNGTGTPGEGSDPSTGRDDNTDARLDELRRLKREAKRARTSSEEATRLTVKYAREGRRKRARAAGNLAFDQAELAKRLRKQARKIERSLKN